MVSIVGNREIMKRHICVCVVHSVAQAVVSIVEALLL